MASTQAFCLRRSNQPSDLVRDFSQMLVDEDLTDVTLSCEDGCIQAHRIFLAANSSYFKSIFANLSNSAIKQYPVIVLKDIKVDEMKALVEFIYRGETTVPQDKLSSILKAANGLKIRGLEGVESSVPNSAGILIGSRKKRRRKRKKSKSGSEASEAGTLSGTNGNSDSENPGLSSEEDDYDEGTQIIAVTDGASTAGDLEPSKLLEQSMSVTSDVSSEHANRLVASRCTSNPDDQSGILSQIDCLNDPMAGHAPGMLSFDASSVPSLPGPSGLGRSPGFPMSSAAVLSAVLGSTRAASIVAGFSGAHSHPAENISMFKSLRGADILNCGGYIYYHYLTRIRPQNNQSVYYWRCDLQSHKDYKCPGRCSTTFNVQGQQIFEQHPVGHNHAPDQARCEAKKQRMPHGVPGSSKTASHQPQLNLVVHPVPPGPIAIHQAVPGLYSHSSSSTVAATGFGHRRGRGHECSICGKVVSRRESLLRHQQVHSYVRSTFVCNWCGSTFSWKHGLTSHERKCKQKKS